MPIEITLSDVFDACIVASLRGGLMLCDNTCIFYVSLTYSYLAYCNRQVYRTWLYCSGKSCSWSINIVIRTTENCDQRSINIVFLIKVLCYYNLHDFIHLAVGDINVIHYPKHNHRNPNYVDGGANKIEIATDQLFPTIHISASTRKTSRN